MDDCEILSIVSPPVWFATAKTRQKAHRGYGGYGCPSEAPYGPKDPQGRALRGVCRDCGCLDAFHDVLEQVLPRARLQATSPGDLSAAWASAVAMNVVADVNRRERGRFGAPQKVAPRTGFDAKVRHALANPWLEELWSNIRGYAGAGTSLAWPLDAWIDDKNEATGGDLLSGSSEARAQISADIDVVLTVARQVMGADVLAATIFEPLASRAGAVFVPREEPTGASTPALEAFATEEDELASLCLGLIAEALSAGIPAAPAVSRAVAQVFGTDAAESELLRNPSRLRRVTEQITEYLAAQSDRPHECDRPLRELSSVR